MPQPQLLEEARAFTASGAPNDPSVAAPPVSTQVSAVQHATAAVTPAGAAEPEQCPAGEPRPMAPRHCEDMVAEDSVATFLEALRAGYGAEWGPAFVDFGLELVEDAWEALPDELSQLEDRLAAAGASPVHIRKMRQALSALRGKGAEGSPAATPATTGRQLAASPVSPASPERAPDPSEGVSPELPAVLRRRAELLEQQLPLRLTTLSPADLPAVVPPPAHAPPFIAEPSLPPPPQSDEADEDPDVASDTSNESDSTVDSPEFAYPRSLGERIPQSAELWDPACLTADRCSDNFAVSQQAELQHGCVSMLATMNVTTSALVGQPIGSDTLSGVAHGPDPTIGDTVEIYGLSGAKELNGRCGTIVAFVQDKQRFGVRLAGGEETKAVKPANVKRLTASRPQPINKVYVAGWAHILAYHASCELYQDHSASYRVAAGKELAVELACGRLALMAISRFLFQDGPTRAPWSSRSHCTAATPHAGGSREARDSEANQRIADAIAAQGGIEAARAAMAAQYTAAGLPPPRLARR